MVTRLEILQSLSWNPMDPSLTIPWLAMPIIVTGVLITMTEECGFVTNLINIM